MPAFFKIAHTIDGAILRPRPANSSAIAPALNWSQRRPQTHGVSVFVS
ncbi:MAG: hypothetical protein ACJ72W_00820 [Actinoallomurus sp.]